MLVTGRSGALTHGILDDSESAVFVRYMERLGVPSRHIIVEPEATNTVENVRFGMSALTAHLSAVDSLLLVAKPFLMRRCIATFRKHYPGVQAIPCPPLGRMHLFVDRPRTNFALRLLAELERLDEYGKKGDLDPQQLSPTVAADARALRHELEHWPPPEPLPER